MVVDQELLALCDSNRLSGFNHFASRDATEVKSQVESLFCSHSFRIVNRQKPLSTGLDYIRLGSSTIVVASYGAEVFVEPGVLEDFYLIQFPLAGSARLNFGKRDDIVRPGTIGFQYPDQPLMMHWSEDCRMVVLRLDRARFERFVEASIGRPQKQPLQLSPLMMLNSAGGQMLSEQVKSSLRCIGQLGPANLPPLLAAHIENSVMSAMLYLQPHNRSQEVSDLLKGSEPRAVRKVRDYLEDHADEPISMELLAEVADVPVRTLYHQFRTALGISPLQMLRDIRLRRAHEELRNPDADTNVTTVAMNWGFEHLGRFSSLYRARYGELPRETLGRSR